MSIKYLLPLCCCMACIYNAAAQQEKNYTISGTVFDSATSQPLEGVTLTLLQNNTKTVSDADGRFTLLSAKQTDTLTAAYAGYNSSIQTVNSNSKGILISLAVKTGQLETVIVNSGYQHISKERSTGSYNFIGNQLINRSVSSGIITRMENLTPGLLINHGDAAVNDLLTIRGRSTIYANAAPLVVVDNFAYDGDINNINPNDVESVTILKDAAAASIWGARAGNGVIVITTKKGKSREPAVEFATSITFTQKPDLFNINQVSGSDYVSIEKYLYNNGFYDWIFDDAYHSPAPPAATILHAAATGAITGGEAQEAIAAMQDHDVRNDLEKYFYRNGIAQQYALNVSGQSDKTNYYFSAGYDGNAMPLQGSSNSRISLRSINTYKPIKNLELNAGVNLTLSQNQAGKNDGYNYSSMLQSKLYYPYARLADNNGNALPVYTDYSKAFIDTAGGGKLLDWTIKPLNEIDEQVATVKLADYVLSAGLAWSFTTHLKLEARYQFEYQNTSSKTYYSPNAYFTRNLVNNFSQVDFSTGVVNYIVPNGGIQDENLSSLTAHQGRAQLSFSRQWDGSTHGINAIAGFEIRSAETEAGADRIYGYQKDHNTVATTMDFKNYYPQYSNPGRRQVPNNLYLSGSTDHFISWYGNAGYSFQNTYDITAGARIDEANLFGVKANQKAAPLWSAGLGWNISNGKFYHASWLPYLKFRATYGYNGNIARKASAYTTISYNTAVLTNTPVATITNPANPNLHWEKTGIFNAGIDFSVKNERLGGSIEFYTKNATGLLGNAPLDPTLGAGPISNPSYYGNVAAMKGSGIDIQLNSLNTRGALEWRSSVIFSWTASKVSNYYMPVSNIGAVYAIGNSINPVVNKPLFSVYSYAWGGLDAENGNPQGYTGGKVTEDYSGIFTGTPVDSMVYSGPSQPSFYGALRNDFTYKGFSLSFNISFKAGYYFRTQSVNYESLFYYWNGNGDFAKRWQQPGDEKKTHVPSMVYPNDYYRDFFYNYSEVLVADAAAIRLEDINFGYRFAKQQFHRLPFQNLRVFIYASNLGVLWKANSFHVDPYYNNIAREGKHFSAGININF